MSRTFTTILLSLGLLAGAASAAVAQKARQVSTSTVSGWAVTGWVNPNGKGSCTAGRNVDQVRVVFQRSASGYALLLRSDAWWFDQHANYPVQFAVASTGETTVRGKVVSSDRIAVPLPKDPRVLRSFAESTEMVVTVANTTIKIPLEQFADVVAALDTCLIQTAEHIAQPAPQIKPAKPTVPAGFPTQKLPAEQHSGGAPLNVQAEKPLIGQPRKKRGA